MKAIQVSAAGITNLAWKQVHLGAIIIFYYPVTSIDRLPQCLSRFSSHCQHRYPERKQTLFYLINMRHTLCAELLITLLKHIPISEISAIFLRQSLLTLNQRETHGCVVSTVATDALLLKHQAISIHNADLTFIVLDQFHIKILHIRWTASENEITFWKKNGPVI